MKKIIPLLLLWSISTTLLAQIEKGTWLAETTFNMATSNIEGDAGLQGFPKPFTQKNVAVSTRLGLGYAIAQNTILGLSFGYQYSKETLTRPHPIPLGIGEPAIQTIGTINNRFSVGIQLQRFIPIIKKVYIVPRLNIGLERVSITPFGDTNYIIEIDGVSSSTTELDRILNYLNVGLSSAIVYQINHRWGIQAQIINSHFRYNYQNDKFPYSEERVSKELGFDINPTNWRLGAFVLFGKK